MEEDYLKVFISRLFSEIELFFYIEINEDKFYFVLCIKIIIE